MLSALPAVEKGRAQEQMTALGLQKPVAPKLDLVLIEAGWNCSLVSVQLFPKMR